MVLGGMPSKRGLLLKDPPAVFALVLPHQGVLAELLMAEQKSLQIDPWSGNPLYIAGSAEIISLL